MALWWMKRTAILTDAKAMYVLGFGDAYYVIWLLLQDIAMQINDDGKVYISPEKPMDVAFLAKFMRRSAKQVAKALDILEDIDLIARDYAGFIQLLTWNELQDYSKLQKQREQTRLRVARHRQKKQEILVESAETPMTQESSGEQEPSVPREDSPVTTPCPEVEEKDTTTIPLSEPMDILQPAPTTPSPADEIQPIPMKETADVDAAVPSLPITDADLGVEEVVIPFVEAMQEEHDAVTRVLHDYTQFWHEPSPQELQSLLTWTKQWGSDAVQEAMTTAYQRGCTDTNRTMYIQAVLETLARRAERSKTQGTLAPKINETMACTL